jgi:hypothetical protein
MRDYTVDQGTLIIDQNSFSIDACNTYKENDNIAVLYIKQLKHFNYEKVSDPVKITIETAEGYKIA